MFKPILSTLLLFPISGALASTVIVADENYDTAPVSRNGLSSGNSNVTVTTTTGDPTASEHGNVGSVDLGGGNAWGEVPTQTRNVAIPVESVPGVDTYTATLDVYIPSDTTFSGGDQLGFILRWNDNTNNQRITVWSWDDDEQLTPDTWETISVTGSLPANGGDGQPLTSVSPALSFHDADDADADPGVAAYIDNFQLEVTAPDEDPNLAAPGALAFGAVEQGKGLATRILTLRNSGASNLLTITEATFGGADSNAFSLPEGTFPLEIAAGATADIEVAFTPGSEFRLYEATLDLASDDQGETTTTVTLSAILVYWKELIINGNFERGNLTGWRDGDRFNHIDQPTHSGTGAAEYNLLGGDAWGEARLDTSSPPATSNDPEAIEITAEMIGKQYEYSAWYYRPETGGMAPDDTVRTILRWNKLNSKIDVFGLNNVGDIPVDTWVQVTGTGVIPELGGDGIPTTSVVPIWSFHDNGANAVGGEVMYIDDVSFKIESQPPPPKLNITEVRRSGDNLIISWESEAGMLYRFRSETDLGAPDPATWPPFAPLEDIEADPPINTESFPIPPEGERFFVIEPYTPPPTRIYFDDFDDDRQGGEWTVNNSIAGNSPATLWEFGAPDSALTGGPAAAYSGTNCYGTNLADNTGLDVMIFLTSPEIDLSDTDGATLNFAHFRGIEAIFDFGRVRVLDSDSGNELASLEPVIDGSGGWENFDWSLPPAALGKKVKFEFYYETDQINPADYPGWYIDDVEVTVP